MKHNIFNLTDILAVIREDYKGQIPIIKKEYEEAKKQIAKDYLGQRRQEEYKKAETEYKKKIADLKQSCKEAYEPIFEELEVEARAKAGVINMQLVEQASAFQNIPLTADEFGAILNTIGGKNYYADRILENIAEKNGITTNGLTPLLEQLSLEPDLETKLHILADLKKQAEHILNNYGTANEDSDARIGALFPDKLRLAERAYTNGLHDDTLSSKQIAVRIIDNIKADPVRSSNIVDNALKNASGTLKNALLNELATNQDKAVISAIERSLSRNDIEVFKMQSMEKYGQAEEAYNNICANLKDDANVDKIIHVNKDNKFLMEMLKSDSGFMKQHKDLLV